MTKRAVADNNARMELSNSADVPPFGPVENPTLS